MNAKFLQINKVDQQGIQTEPKLHQLVMGVVVTVSTVIAAIPSALAHDTTTVYPQCCGARQGQGGVYSNHTVIQACDTKRDNWGIKTQALTRSGYIVEVYDGLEFPHPCQNKSSGFGSGLDAYRVCIYNQPNNNETYCTSWQQP